MVVFKKRVHPLNFLRSKGLDDKQFVIALVELGAALSGRVIGKRLRTRQRLLVVEVVDAKALADVTEHHRAVFLYFKVRRHVFPTRLRQIIPAIFAFF